MAYEPLGLLSGSLAAEARATGMALPLAGGPLAFTNVAEHRRDGPVRFHSIVEIDVASLAPLTQRRARWGRLDLARPRVMGVLNVTPDSFSDGGAFHDPGAAVAHGLALAAAGADIVDVGGESTRPGTEATDEDEERRRVVPVVKALSDQGVTVSVDSRRAGVMSAALDSGARIINDVSALEGPGSLAVAQRAQVPVVLMHMRGSPRTMQQATSYDHLLLDVFDYLAARLKACGEVGIPPQRIVLDPGIGFAKTADQNLAILGHLGLFHGLGCGLLVGASRKSFIGRLAGGAPATDRLGGSLAAALHAVARGAQIVRVHDVAETVQALKIWHAVVASPDAETPAGAAR
ncbi:MAG: dihydropteroate synthase [Alphaproteobacteria bacterium]|nr:dihydropteroate synthase [Alphaproteobacteria bacterium]